MTFRVTKNIKLFQISEPNKSDKNMLDIMEERYNMLLTPGKITKKRDWI